MRNMQGHHEGRVHYKKLRSFRLLGMLGYLGQRERDLPHLQVGVQSEGYYFARRLLLKGAPARPDLSVASSAIHVIDLDNRPVLILSATASLPFFLSVFIIYIFHCI